MARLDPKLIAQLKADLQEINKLYQAIGKAPISIDIDTAGIDDVKLIKLELKDAREENELLFGSFRDVKREVDDLFSGLNSVTDEIKNGRQGFDLAKKAVGKLTDVMGSVKDIQDDIVNANSTDLKKLQEKALSERKNLEESQRLLQSKVDQGEATLKEEITLQNINGLLEDQNGLFQDIAATLEQVVRNEQQVEDITGSLGAGVEGLSSGMKKAGLGAVEQRLGLEDALKSTKDMVKASGGNVSKMKAAGHLAKAVGKNLLKAANPAALIAAAIDQAVKAFMLIDSSSGEVAKNMGISAEEGRALVASSADAAALSGDLLVSTKDIVKAQMALNEQFGVSVAFSSKFATDFASIQEKTGLSAESMGLFAEQAMFAGGTVKDQLVDITAVTQEMSAQSGVMMSQKSIQEGLKELSASQRLNAGLSTKEMAKQVFQAKLLGVSQSQLENSASSLLDFESSIAKEMEAELLTGKQLNLEGARQAALMGDQEALARELSKNIGTAADFQNMMVPQQEALAAAMGMTKDELAETLITQEKNEKIRAAGFKSLSDAQNQYNEALKAGNLSEEKKKQLAEAGVLAQLESATAQDKMNAAMQKLTDLFVQIIDPLMPLVDVIMSVLEPIFAILSPILKLIGDLTGLVMNVLMPAFDATTNFLSNISSGFTEMFGGVFEIIGGILSFDFDMILGGFKKIAKGAIQLLLAPFQAVVDLVVGTLNTIIDGINYIPGVDINAIPSPDLAGLLGGAIGLAEGGIVPATPGGVPAVIGEGGESEVVMPLSKLPSLMSGLGMPASVMETGSSLLGKVGNFASNLFGGDDSEGSTVEELKTLNAKIDKLITVVEKGGDVYIDGNKAGKSLALATSEMG